MSTSRVRHILNELQKITPRERNFLFNFLMTRTGNSSVDDRNFSFDLELGNYRNSARLMKIYNLTKNLSENEIKKIARKLGL